MIRRAFLHAMAGVALAGISRPKASAGAGDPLPSGFTLLRIVQGELSVDGKTGRVYRIEQENGLLGWSGRRGDRFKVAVENAVAEPLSIHWHGIILPNGQDGVPYVTQAPIKPGERRLYDFPLVQTGTYWMHSHFGLQEQPMMTAPLIIRDSSPAEPDAVVMLNDFTTQDPGAILAELKGNRKAPSMAGMKMGREGMPAAGGTKMAMKGADLADVRYDALLANRRPLADPDVIRVSPGEAIRLRVINMASGTNFFVSTGTLKARIVAVDGEDVAPLPGTRFELGIAQRIDLLVEIPPGEAAYPILAQGEGTDMLAGIVLATPAAALPTLSARAPKQAGALTNAQEARLRALYPVASRPVDRRLRVALGGDMAKYVWSLNGQVWPRITPLEVRRGERVEIAFVNTTGMTHPMHLHGHVFQVTAIGNARVPGARRDTVMVTPGQTVTVEFDALYPGYWMIHCHLLYHQAAGMMTVMRYQGFEDRAYDPMASVSEFRR